LHLLSPHDGLLCGHVDPAACGPPAPFTNWIKGEGKVEPVPLDKDVFGDGSVIMLYTPGHHSLLVKLPQMGAVVISGDLAHFRENYDTNGLPEGVTERAKCRVKHAAWQEPFRRL
jgi:N-acyl homoserine lactone hydrolase